MTSTTSSTPTLSATEAFHASQTFYSNQVLFGHDQTTGIIDVKVGDDDTVRVWRRVDGRLQLDIEPFTPFLWLQSEALLEGGPTPVAIETLEGAGTLKVLARFHQGDLSALRKHLQKASGETPGSPDAPYRLLADLEHQYLLWSGRTSFKRLGFGDLVRMQIDIATQCEEGFEFANPQRPEDVVVAIAVATNSGFETVLRTDDMGEKAVLERLNAIVAEHDPDVIEGHDLFRYVLEYLRVRAQRHKLKLTWGRDATPMSRRASQIAIASQNIAYPRYDAIGRHLVDTWLLAHYFDISDRGLPSFDLGDVSRHSGALDEHGCIELRQVRSGMAELDAHCLRRLRHIRAVSNLLSPIYFLQAQMFPYGFQNVIVRGNATRIDSLFLREYLRRRQALPPIQSNPVAFEGGYTDLFESGVVAPVWQVDAQSLYPSLMLTHHLKPRADELDLFMPLLRDLFEFRVQAKTLAKAAERVEDRAYFGALQLTFKILINSFYGYLGTSFCHFADASAASEVTRHGRELVKDVVESLRARGCRPIEVDTDGVYFVPRPGADPDTLLAELSEKLPPTIRLELGGRYLAMFAHKPKNYALLESDGSLTIRGSGLRSRGMEKYLRDFLEEMLALVLQSRGGEVRDALRRRLDAIAARQVAIDDLAKSETLSEALDSYKKKIAAKKRNPGAAYEIAIASGRPYKPGDAITYYVSGDTKKVKVYEAARPLTAWNAAAPDENVDYYQQKLLELAKKFEEYY
jgi:DNA polymerase elongation subunit (family B)